MLSPNLFIVLIEILYFCPGIRLVRVYSLLIVIIEVSKNISVSKYIAYPRVSILFGIIVSVFQFNVNESLVNLFLIEISPGLLGYFEYITSNGFEYSPSPISFTAFNLYITFFPNSYAFENISFCIIIIFTLLMS